MYGLIHLLFYMIIIVLGFIFLFRNQHKKCSKKKLL